MRVIASGFANAAWRTGLTQNKVDHPGSPSSGFHSSVTVERGPRELTGLILPRLSATTGRTKPNATRVRDGISKSGDYRADDYAWSRQKCVPITAGNATIN